MAATKARMDHMKRLNTIFFHFLIQGGAVDSKYFCCGTNIPTLLLQGLLNHPLFMGLQVQTRVGRCQGFAFDTGSEGERGNHSLIGQDDRFLYGMFQFTDIARPGMGDQLFDGPFR